MLVWPVLAQALLPREVEELQRVPPSFPVLALVADSCTQTGTRLGLPVRRIFAACTVFGLDCHELCNLTENELGRPLLQNGLGVSNVLLQSATFIAQLSDFLQQDAHLIREGLAEVV